MHRRPLGRGRTLAAIAGVLIVVACVLPWWMVGGGEPASPPRAATRFEGAGIVVFLVGIACWRSSRCRTPPATGRSASTAGSRS